ncbi:hypothetical protein ACLB2K_006405 [Fragaria x ananassa]
MRALLFKLSAKCLFNNQSSLRFFCNTVSDVVIHPSAIVHPNAVLGQGVSIGPFCTVGSSVKLGNGCRLHPGSHVFGNTQLGERCVLMTGAIVGDEIPGRTVLGCNNVIGHHAVVGVKCQDMKYKSGDECFLDVGDNNEIREYASIHRSSKSSDTTVIGNNNLIMGSCHIAHDCKVGNNVILANNTLLAGHVVVEDYAHTAGAVVVHQFCHVGSFAFIGGGSVIAQDVPKYMMVAGERAQLRGLNLEGLWRHGFTVAEIRSLRTAYQKIFMPADANASGFEARLAEVELHDKLAHIPAVCSMSSQIAPNPLSNFIFTNQGSCFHYIPVSGKMSQQQAKFRGWAAFDLKQRQKNGLEPQIDKDPFPPIAPTIKPLQPCKTVLRNNEVPRKPFSSVFLPSVDVASLVENRHSKRSLLDGNSSRKHTPMEDQGSSIKKIKDLYSWADDSLVEDIMAAVDNDITKASNLLKAMVSPSRSEENKETSISGIDPTHSSTDATLSDKSFSSESAADIAELNSTIEKCLIENNIEWSNDNDLYGPKLSKDAGNVKLTTSSLESVPVEPEWEEDDVYLRIRKDALRMMRSASQNSKAAANAFGRGDHYSAQQYSIKARKEWLVAESLNNRAAKEILSIRNSNNDVSKLDLHGLHASEAIRALQEHLEKIERKILPNHSALTNRVKMESNIQHSSVESFSCLDTENLDQLQASSRQRPTSLQVITGIGNHSRGQAALPTAVSL